MCSTLRGLRQQKLVRRAAELAGGDFTLADLEDCTVLLLGRLPALRILQARRCCIVAGPVDGAAYLEGVQTWADGLASHAYALKCPAALQRWTLQARLCTKWLEKCDTIAEHHILQCSDSPWPSVLPQA
jgi:Tubulin binding cofactor C